MQPTEMGAFNFGPTEKVQPHRGASLRTSAPRELPIIYGKYSILLFDQVRCTFRQLILNAAY